MKTKQIRQAYGEALVRIGERDERVIVLDSDVANSTKSCLFGKKYPERFFDVGISEANMAGMAAGLATTGNLRQIWLVWQLVWQLRVKFPLLILLLPLWFFVLVILFVAL